MIFGHRSKNITIIIAITSFVLGALLFNYLPIIFQEGNPWPQIKAITKLNFSKSDIVKLSDSNNTYLTKSQNGFVAIKTLMRNKGYEFTEQMGSGYFFKSPIKTIIITRRQYSRLYTIWTIIEIEQKVKLINELELRECLPKSDMASYEKCKELLRQITDYDSCISAGFAIMKSNPPQCATPDGRIFIENKNN